MQPGGIVVAIGAATVVVGIAVVEGAARHIDSVDGPRQTLIEGFVAAHHLKLRQGDALLMVVVKPLHHIKGSCHIRTIAILFTSHIKEYAVGMRMAAEHIDSLSQGVTVVPVVGIEEADIVALRQLQRLVAGIGLAVVFVEAQGADSVIAGGIVSQHLGRGVGRSVIGHYHLYPIECLRHKRVEALGQKGGTVVHSHDY